MTYISPGHETDHGRILRKKELVTVSETAEILGISERSVWNFIRRGILDRVKIGQSARVTTASIREIIYGWKYEEERGVEGLSGMTQPVVCN